MSERKLPETPEELVKRIKGYFQLARRIKEPLHQKWKGFYRAWRGLDRSKAPGGRSQELINIIFATVESKVALLGDSRPGFVFYPQEGGDVNTADAIQSIVSDYVRDVTNMDTEEEAIRLDAAIVGSGLGMYYWNAAEREIGFKRIDPFAVFPAPGARKTDDGKFLIIAEATPIYEIKRRFGERARNVKGDAQLLKAIEYDKNGYDIFHGKEFDESDVAEMTLVLYCWTYDDTTEQVTEVIRETSAEGYEVEMESVTEQPKYPNGRLTIVAGDSLLWDGPNPLPIKGRPFVKFDYVPDPNSFWGIGEVEFLIDPAKMVNKRKNQIQDNTDILANGRTFVDVTRIPEWKKIRGKAREIVPVNGNPRNAVYIDYGTPLPAHVLHDLNDSLNWINLISGLQDVGRGVIPKGDPSGAALQLIMESVNVRVRKVARSWERFLKASATMAIEMLKLYTPDKVFAILGDEYAQAQYVKYDDLNLNVKYNIRVRAGSTLPTNRQAKLELAIRLVQAGILPPDIALELIDLPEVKLLLKKREEQQAPQMTPEMLAAMAAQLQGGQPNDEQ